MMPFRKRGILGRQFVYALRDCRWLTFWLSLFVCLRICCVWCFLLIFSCVEILVWLGVTLDFVMFKTLCGFKLSLCSTRKSRWSANRSIFVTPPCWAGENWFVDVANLHFWNCRNSIFCLLKPPCCLDVVASFPPVLETVLRLAFFYHLTFWRNCCCFCFCSMHVLNWFCLLSPCCYCR